MLSKHDVVLLYRALLDREPESDELIEWTTNIYKDIREAASGIMRSEEFKLLERQLDDACCYLTPPNASAQRESKLALAAIVKNEQHNIERMLQSCQTLVSFVAIVDTGSTDNTLQTAEASLKGARIPYQFVEITFLDFSHARNTALDLVPEWVDWVIMLDADEHLVPEDFTKLKALLEVQEVDAWQLPRYNFNDNDKRQPASPYPDYQKRLLRNRTAEKIRFSGAVHEMPVNVGRWGLAPINDFVRTGYSGGPHIHHMGQVNLSAERWAEKHKFYSDLAAAAKGA